MLGVLPHRPQATGEEATLTQVPDRCSCIQQPGTRRRQLRDGMAAQDKKAPCWVLGRDGSVEIGAWMQVLVGLCTDSHPVGFARNTQV